MPDWILQLAQALGLRIPWIRIQRWIVANSLPAAKRDGYTVILCDLNYDDEERSTTRLVERTLRKIAYLDVYRLPLSIQNNEFGDLKNKTNQEIKCSKIIERCNGDIIIFGDVIEIKEYISIKIYSNRANLLHQSDDFINKEDFTFKLSIDLIESYIFIHISSIILEEGKKFSPESSTRHSKELERIERLFERIPKHDVERKIEYGELLFTGYLTQCAMSANLKYMVKAIFIRQSLTDISGDPDNRHRETQLWVFREIRKNFGTYQSAISALSISSDIIKKGGSATGIFIFNYLIDLWELARRTPPGEKLSEISRAFFSMMSPIEDSPENETVALSASIMKLGFAFDIDIANDGIEKASSRLPQLSTDRDNFSIPINFEILRMNFHRILFQIREDEIDECLNFIEKIKLRHIEHNDKIHIDMCDFWKKRFNIFKNRNNENYLRSILPHIKEMENEYINSSTISSFISIISGECRFYLDQFIENPLDKMKNIKISQIDFEASKRFLMYDMQYFYYFEYMDMMKNKLENRASQIFFEH